MIDDEDNYYDFGHIVVDEGIEIVDDEQEFWKTHPRFSYSNNFDYVTKKTGFASYI